MRVGTSAPHVPSPDVGRREETARFASAIEPRLNARLCYCSLFEDCWVRDERKSDEPQPVTPDRCEGPKAIEFAR